MKIISWNVNGIRAITKKNFFNDLIHLNADILCLQETKAQDSQVLEALKPLNNYHIYSHSAVKPGYSGTAVISKVQPIKVTFGIGIEEHDTEGRVLCLELIGFEYADPAQRNGLISSLLKTGTTILLFAEEGADLEYKKHEIFPDQLILLSSAPGLDGLIEDPNSNKRYISLTGMSNVLNLWLLNVEFIAACTRRERMPNIFVSVMHPRGFPINGYNFYYKFFQEHQIKPIERGSLARELIFKVSALSHKIVEPDTATGIAESADWIHSTINSKTSHIQESVQGHWATNLSLNDYTPDIFKYTGKLKAGDLKIFLGYSFYPTDNYCYPLELMEPLLSSGVRVIFMTTSDTDQDKFKGIQMQLLDKPLLTWEDIPRVDNLLLIDGHWPQFDAGICIPDYPYPIIPLLFNNHEVVFCKATRIIMIQ